MPGRHPHPIASPQGHSYRPPGEPEPLVHWHPPEAWRTCDDYLYGCDLYNHAYWWEAHEAWEGLWRVTPRESAQHAFLQGLIQTTACHLKRLMRSPDGVARLRTTSLGYLRTPLMEAGEGPYMGLPLRKFVDALVSYDAYLMRAESGPLQHDASRFPYLTLSD